MPRIVAPSLRSARRASPGRAHGPRRNPSYPFDIDSLELYLPESAAKDERAIYKAFESLARKTAMHMRWTRKDPTRQQLDAVLLNLSWLAGAYYELVAMRCLRPMGPDEARAAMIAAGNSLMHETAESLRLGAPEVDPNEGLYWSRALDLMDSTLGTIRWGFASHIDVQRLVPISFLSELIDHKTTLFDRFFEPESSQNCELLKRYIRARAAEDIDQNAFRYTYLSQYQPIGIERFNFLFDGISTGLAAFEPIAEVYDEASLAALRKYLAARERTR